VRQQDIGAKLLAESSFSRARPSATDSDPDEWNDLFRRIGRRSSSFLWLVQEFVVQSLVRPLFVVVGQVLSTKMIHVLLAKDDESVEALLADRLYQAFREGIGIGDRMRFASVQLACVTARTGQNGALLSSAMVPPPSASNFMRRFVTSVATASASARISSFERHNKSVPLAMLRSPCANAEARQPIACLTSRFTLGCRTALEIVRGSVGRPTHFVKACCASSQPGHVSART
jgi:hypothetical protein